MLNRHGQLSRDEALDFALQILLGLDTAHALGVVHRDLKPDNVFVTPSNGGPLLKLIDFGIAKLREQQRVQEGAHERGCRDGHSRIHGARAARTQRTRSTCARTSIHSA